VLVCVGPDAASARLVRAARRVAAGLKADWIAVYVETPAHGRLSEAARDIVAQNLRLAEQLGAQAITLSGHSVSDEILAYAREHNVTRIVVGKPTQSRWRQGLRRSLLEALVRGSGNIDVHVITGDADQPGLRPPVRYGPTSKPSHYAAAAAAIGVATVLCHLTRPWLQTVDFAMLYLLAVVFVASRYRRGPSLLASLLAIAAFDFAFVPPYFTFSVSDAQYILTFAVMLVIALVMSRLTAQIREQAEAARAREERTASLYAMSRELAALTDEDALAEAVARHLGNTFAGTSLVLLPDNERGLIRRPASAPQLPEKEASVARWTFDHASPAGLGTATLPAARALYVPMVSSGSTVGVLGLTPADPRRLQNPVQRQLLDAFADQAAVAFERVALARRNQEGQLAFEAERLRTSLLSSLSHDLRTPLATIAGAASTLVQDGGSLSGGARRELAQGILHEADRMTRLVRNLLDMVRLESGMLQVQKEWYPLEEVIGVVLIRLDDRLAGHPVSTSLPPDLPLLQMDGLLMEQVLINLLENAVRHTPAGTRIEISASFGAAAVTVEVADRGPGIPAGQEELIFDKFHRLPSADPQSGSGLGLAICRGIVQAHGGRIWVVNRAGGGAAFRFTIPIGSPPPVVRAAPAEAVGEPPAA
jgi:two-component system sensor histidine kinase KdpD